jgi:N-acetylglucosamine kinase-like BadF-type ATPase
VAYEGWDASDIDGGKTGGGVGADYTGRKLWGVGAANMVRNMTYLMGIDGGGSNLRVVIARQNLEVVAKGRAGTANPSVIGREMARGLVQRTMREVIQEAGLAEGEIGAVGIGIAGASVVHSREWLGEVVSQVLPNAVLAASSDIEIALVGAHGARRGILILAGTGSVAYGVNAAGESVQVGGWGYLMGDEGGGYWIGMEGLKTVMRAENDETDLTGLSAIILEKLELKTSRDLIRWLYGADKVQIRQVAALAPLIMQAADGGDSVAQQIIHRAAEELAQLGGTVKKRLKMDKPKIGFAGGLLGEPNLLSRRLMELLKLEDFPQALYPPVIGAALLAKLTLDSEGM